MQNVTLFLFALLTFLLLNACSAQSGAEAFAANQEASSRPHEGSEGIPGYIVRPSLISVTPKTNGSSGKTSVTISAPAGSVVMSDSTPVTAVSIIIVQAPTATLETAQQTGISFNASSPPIQIPVLSDGSFSITIKSTSTDPFAVGLGLAASVSNAVITQVIDPSLFLFAFPGMYSTPTDAGQGSYGASSHSHNLTCGHKK